MLTVLTQTAFRGSPPTAVAIYLERSPAAMPVTNTKSVRLGRFRNRSDRPATGTGPQAHPVWAHPIRARRHRIRQRLLLCTAGDLVSTVKAAGSELSYQQRN